MALTILRHTITAAPPGTVYGQLDVPLGATAETDLENAINGLSILPNLIVTSPLQRCHQLATYLANRRNAALRIDERLMELHFGAWEGQQWSDLAGPELDHWMQHYITVAPPGGESYQELANRVEQALNEYLELAQNQEVVWVTHLGVARAVQALRGKFTLEDSFSWKLAFGTAFTL